jgi:hypothetical protein
VLQDERQTLPKLVRVLDPQVLDIILERSAELGELRVLAGRLRERGEHQAASVVVAIEGMHATALDVCCHLLGEVERLSARLAALETSQPFPSLQRAP